MKQLLSRKYSLTPSTRHRVTILSGRWKGKTSRLPIVKKHFKKCLNSSVCESTERRGPVLGFGLPPPTSSFRERHPIAKFENENLRRTDRPIQSSLFPLNHRVTLLDTFCSLRSSPSNKGFLYQHAILHSKNRARSGGHKPGKGRGGDKPPPLEVKGLDVFKS